MAKEYWYVAGVVLAVVLPLALLLAVKKLHLLDIRPDEVIDYKVVNKQTLSLHAFRAKNKPDNAPSPALLFFHGGGWQYGSPAQFYPQCLYFSEHGYTCFSAQYRLGSDNQPDVRGAVADARSALEYLLDHAAELHIDPQKLLLGGGSAGGHLAAVLGTDPTPAGDSSGNERRPAALILYNPILDLSPGSLYHNLVKDHWQDVSPIDRIDHSASPSLILVGSQDVEVPVATVEAFCEAMQSAGGHCEMALYEGQGHGFFNQTHYLEITNQRVLQFLSELPGQK